jgi:hypothetical protein
MDIDKEWLYIQRVLDYADHTDNTEALIEYVRSRFEAGLAEESPEEEFSHWVDAMVADYYG